MLSFDFFNNHEDNLNVNNGFCFDDQIHFLSNANFIFLTKQNGVTKENVSPTYVVLSFAFLSIFGLSNEEDASGNIKTLADVYLACASLNCLNRYVKQKTDPRISYIFKPWVEKMVRQCQSNNIEGVSIKSGYDKGDTLISVFVGPVQFSFHGVPKNAIFLQNLTSNGEVPFDGIKKQICASTVFESSMSFYKMFELPNQEADLVLSKAEKTLSLFRQGGLNICKSGLVWNDNGNKININDDIF